MAQTEKDATRIMFTISNTSKNYLSRISGAGHLPVILLFVVISFFHLWRISDIPRGLGRDELSIGYNASLIAGTGYDEHHHFFPTFFEAFGEFKNPLYIYAVSLIFRLFGVSEYGLRVTSFVFFFLFLAGFHLLVTKIFRENRTISLYALLSAGFLPWFFPLSRIAYEVVSQLTMVIYSLLFVYLSYHPEQTKYERLYPALAGLFLGLSVYSYSTARLLSFLLLLSVVLVYLRRGTVKKSMIIVSMFSVSLVPYLMFAANNPGALTRRFERISYLYDSSAPVFEKMITFLKRYHSYTGLDFLLFGGDRNLRHATGYGGEVFIVVFVLCAVGLVWLMIHQQALKDKFALLMFVNLLLSPCAASLTTGRTNAVRSVLVGLYILVFSCYGLASLLRMKEGMRRGILIGAVFVALLSQASLYLTEYFTNYEKESAIWFETYGFKDALITAVERGPKRIIVEKTKWAYVCAAFYKNFIHNPRQIPISVGTAVPENDVCIIYFERTKHDSPPHPDELEISGPGNKPVRLRCY